MSENKETLTKRLGFGGVALTLLLCVATAVLNILLTASLALWFSTYGLEDTERILETLKVEDVDLSAVFSTRGEALAFLSTWQGVLAVLSVLVLLLILWAVFYKISDYYASRAIGIYAKATIIAAVILIVLSILSSPVISYYLEDFADKYDVQLRSFCAVIIIASLVLLIIGIISAIVSLVISSVEGAPRKKLIDDELLAGSIRTHDIIQARKKERERVAKAKNAEKKATSKKKLSHTLNAAEITPHENDALPESGNRFCAACGARLKPGALYCGKCGEKI